jgi:hypothetical protein
MIYIYIKIFKIFKFKFFFGLCWNLKLVIIELLWYLEGFGFLLEDLFED